jgi:hypothetical protein
MKTIEATESARRPFCLFDKATGDYVRKSDGGIKTFKTREEAEAAK